MNLEFKTKEELLKRVEPALNAKESEFLRLGYYYIKKQDLINYLIENKWNNKSNLSLYDIVDDILKIDSKIIDRFLKNKLSRRKDNIYDREKFYEN